MDYVTLRTLILDILSSGYSCLRPMYTLSYRWKWSSIVASYRNKITYKKTSRIPDPLLSILILLKRIHDACSIQINSHRSLLISIQIHQLQSCYSVRNTSLQSTNQTTPCRVQNFCTLFHGSHFFRLTNFRLFQCFSQFSSTF